MNKIKKDLVKELDKKMFQYITEEDQNDMTNKNNLDVALTTLTGKMKVYNQNIYLIDFKKYEKYIGSFLDGNAQSKYKYIFNVEGNSQAYRYSTEFAKQSIILNFSYIIFISKFII